MATGKTQIDNPQYEEDSPQESAYSNETERVIGEFLNAMKLSKNDKQKHAAEDGDDAEDRSDSDVGDDDDDDDYDDDDTETEDEEKERDKYLMWKRTRGKRKQEDTESVEEEEQPKKRRKARQLESSKDMEIQVKGEERSCDLQKIKHVQQKCTLTSFRMLIDNHRKSIPQEAWDLINRTCFGSTIEAFRLNKITDYQVKKLEADFEIIMKHYNHENKSFIFGETEVEITEDDVYSIFEITKEGLDVDLSRDEPYKKGKKKVQESEIFGKHTRKPITRKIIEDTLIKELNIVKKEDPRKIASLVIMYLMSVLFFSRTGNHIEWKLILKCEDLENISTYNWSRKVLEFLHEGLKKHNKEKPQTLNGCLLLVLYWFLEKTKVNKQIVLKEKEKPRFVRWSTKQILNEEEYLRNPSMLEDLIRKGPWDDDEEMSSSENEEQEDEYVTPSFKEWVPQSIKQEEEQNEKMCGNLRSLIRDLEWKLPKEEMDQKLKELMHATEELINKNTELLGKLKKADDQIQQLEQQRRADQNQINALKIQLRKEKNKEQKWAQKQQMICVTQEEQGEKEWKEDRSKPDVEEYRQNVEEDSFTQDEQKDEHFSMPIEVVPLRRISPEDEDPIN